MKILLLRHGETVEGAQGILLGSIGGTLSDKGKAQAETMAEGILRSGFRPDRIVSSPLDRATDTSEIISKKMNLPVEINNDVSERRAGEIEGKRDEEIDWTEYERQPFEWRKHKGGESYEDVKIRVEKFLNNLEGRDFILVTHSALIRILISIFLGISVEETSDVVKGVDFRGRTFVLDTETKKMETIDLK